MDLESCFTLSTLPASNVVKHKKLRRRSPQTSSAHSQISLLAFVCRAPKKESLQNTVFPGGEFWAGLNEMKWQVGTGLEKMVGDHNVDQKHQIIYCQCS